MAEIHKLDIAGPRTVGQRHIYTQEIVKLLLSKTVGSTVTYDEMSERIGMKCSPTGDGYGYQASAREILEKEHDIVFENVETIGYRRLSSEEVAKSTVRLIQRKKAGILRRAKRRIETINDEYDSLSQEAKTQATLARTIIAFDMELNKGKRMKQIADRVSGDGRLLGFGETLGLFK